MSNWATIGERVADKWQIPLFVVSLGLLAAALVQGPTKDSSLPWGEAVDQLETLLAHESYERALTLGYSLLDRAGVPDEQKADVHLQLARARYGDGVAKRAFSAPLGRRIVDHYRQADRFALPLSAEDFHRLGRAFAWQQLFSVAQENLKKALEQNCGHESELRRHIYRLARTRLSAPDEELNEMLGDMLARMPSHRLDHRIWAVEQKIDVLSSLGRLDEASTLLVEERKRFDDSDFVDRIAYQEGLQLYHLGHYDDAEAKLRTIRNRLDAADPLYAKTGWLLGRIVMSDGGPQRPAEAMSFFNDVLAHHPTGEYAVGCHVGLAEALAYQERHDEAVGRYKDAITELKGAGGDAPSADPEVLLVSFRLMADYLRQQGDLEAALGYVQLGLPLLSPLDDEGRTSYLQNLLMIQTPLAEELERRALQGAAQTPEGRRELLRRSRELFADAADKYVDLVQMTTFNEYQSANASWRAAEFYARAQRRERAIQLFREFVKERPQSTLVPNAKYRTGQLLREIGRFQEAVEAFQDCYRSHARTLDGARSLVPLAQSYLAIGPGNEEMAERALLIVLEESEALTPMAPEYAEALYLLGDVLNRRSHFERSIGTLVEALERYPSHPASTRARFLLADSYRQSALALKGELADASFDAEYQQMLGASTERFKRAREYYHDMVVTYQSRGVNTLAPLDALYHRHAALYEADCYFETGEYRKALKLYEEAAATFKESTSSLAAYVQIINCYVFLGQEVEAGTALARALVLADAIPDAAFSHAILPEGRQDWKRYFEWLGNSELF